MIFILIKSMPLPYIFVISILVLYISVKRRNSSRKSEKSMFSPPKLPIIGNIHQISPPYHQSLHSLSLKYGPLMLLQFGEVPSLIVSSSDMACAIMCTHDLTFASRPPIVVTDIIRFRDMAFEPYGENWRQLKKIFTIHLVTTKKLTSYKAMREEEVGNLIATISNHASLLSSNPIKLNKVLFLFMINVICRVVSKKNIMGDHMHTMMKEVIEENFHLAGKFSIGDLFPSLPWLEGLIGLSKRAKGNRAKWDLLFEKLIQAHIQSEENEEQDSFVDILLSLKDDPSTNFDLTIDNIKGLLFDTFSAGVDTTCITLNWAMSELIKNAKPMKKLREEVRGIVKRNDMVRSEDLNKMSYLKAIIKETLRLHPPVPLLIPRKSMRECKINGLTIPKGTKVHVNAWAIGREEKSWEQPEEFIPERFINSQVDYKGNDFQFIPFGAGRRICPGISFATATIELALANLVHHFDWELPNGMTIEEFNMDDSPGFFAHRKEDLSLVVKNVQLE